MVERIDKLAYMRDPPVVRGTTLEGMGTDLFLTSPAEFLCRQIAEILKLDPAWKAFFGDEIDGYKRMDYGLRSLPALRIYNNDYSKTGESWFIEGDVILDLILPASIRRSDLQQIPDTLSGALLQQMRRVDFFNAVCAKVPALNELGKKFSADKSLAFEFKEDELVPLVQMRANFRMDLRIWDDYLESDYRTKDDPFVRTLADLRLILNTIDAVDDAGVTQVEIKDAPP